MGGNQQAVKGQKQAESLEGVLERITFYNEENGFLIGKLKGQTKTAEIAVVGKAPKVQCGETLLLTGSWTTHPKHGRQFSFTSFESKLPASAYGIRKYLASGLIHGIGKTYANKIVDHFGADTLRVISEESARLKEIEGIKARESILLFAANNPVSSSKATSFQCKTLFKVISCGKIFETT